MDVQSSAGLQDEYLTLLVTQLQNQDPLEPVSQDEFIGQVAQFSQLSEIESLNASFAEMVQLQSDLFRLQEVSLGTAMVGKTAHYTAAADESSQQGTVTGFEVADGRVNLLVNDTSVPVADVVSIS
jgi:flagellar basal-body rod modification protein FlgD